MASRKSKALRRRRPAEIIRRDLKGHVTLMSCLAEIVNQHNKHTMLYVDYGWESTFDNPAFLKFKGLKRGFLSEMVSGPDPNFVEGVYEVVCEVGGPTEDDQNFTIISIEGLAGVPEDPA